MSLTTRRLRAAVVAVLGAAAAVGIVGPVEPAAADDFYCCRHWVVGEIDAAYRRSGGPGGVLGCPVTDELGNPDGVGKRSQFEGGTIYWHPDTGAHTVWGAIGSAWGSMGWEGGRLGYPITDELGSPDGVGRYSDFQRGTIYWGEGFTCTVDGADIPGDRSAAWGFARETGQRRCGEAWRRVVPLLVGGRYGSRLGSTSWSAPRATARVWPTPMRARTASGSTPAMSTTSPRTGG